MITDGRYDKFTVSCVCDSTLCFLLELKEIVKSEGYEITEVESRKATENEIPKDKPWCNWYYAVTGERWK